VECAVSSSAYPVEFVARAVDTVAARAIAGIAAVVERLVAGIVAAQPVVATAAGAGTAVVVAEVAAAEVAVAAAPALQVARFVERVFVDIVVVVRAAAAEQGAYRPVSLRTHCRISLYLS